MIESSEIFRKISRETDLSIKIIHLIITVSLLQPCNFHGTVNLQRSSSRSVVIEKGDPLLPYLFVLDMERLTHLISQAVEREEWVTIQISR